MIRVNYHQILVPYELNKIFDFHHIAITAVKENLQRYLNLYLSLKLWWCMIKKTTFEQYINLKWYISFNNKEFYCNFEKLTNILYAYLKENKFPSIKKLPRLAQFLKTLDNTWKGNYRPRSTLPNFTELFKSNNFSLVNNYMGNEFSTSVTNFTEDHNTHDSLLKVIESRKARVNRSKVGVVIMN